MTSPLPQHFAAIVSALVWSLAGEHAAAGGDSALRTSSERSEDSPEQGAADLAAAGYEALDLTKDDLAVVHLRHMVGGRSPEAVDERLYSFEFPERPGALLQFLESLDESWNISLFHYRNLGADYGRVLAGIQVPASHRASFLASLDRLGYPYWDETDNQAYRLFLDKAGG